MTIFASDKLRNVVLLGHGGAGKTSLAEAMLFDSGAVNRLGRVDDGTAVADWDEEERRRKMSINLSLIPSEVLYLGRLPGEGHGGRQFSFPLSLPGGG